MKNKLVLKLLAMGLVALIGMAPMSAYAATPIYHVHSGSEASGTGCYSKTIYHKHTGNESSNGGCYTTANYHSHTGDSASGGGCYTTANYHSHTGNSASGGGCYTTANYHSHTGDSASGGGCYGETVYHVHTGDSTSGGGCYTTAVCHVHSGTAYSTYQGKPISASRTGCYTSVISIQTVRNCGTFRDPDGDGLYNCDNCGSSCAKAYLPTGNKHDPIGSKDVYTLGCGKSTSTVERYEQSCNKTNDTIDGYNLNCGKTTSTVESYSLGCGKTTSTVESYSLGCGKTTSTVESYSLGCGKVTTTIEGYSLGCGKTTSTIEGYKDEPSQSTGNTGSGDDGNTGSNGTTSSDKNNGETGSSSNNKENDVTNTTKEQGKADTTELDEKDVVGNKSYSNPSNLVIQTGVNGSAGNEGISGSENGVGDELNKESMNVVEPAAGVGLAMNPGVLAGVGVVGGGLGAGFFLLFGLLGSTPATLSIVTIKGIEERKFKIKNKKNFYIAKITNKWIEYASSASIQLEQEFIDKHRGEQLKVIIDDTEYVTTVSENITFDLT